MNQMVKNLLTLNQLEFGDEDVEFERFDPGGSCAGGSSEHGDPGVPGFSSGGVPQEEPVYVWADEFKTEQVIRNYVSNAFHHASGEKVIEVKIVVEGKKARTSVFNTGTPDPGRGYKPHLGEILQGGQGAHQRIWRQRHRIIDR